MIFSDRDGEEESSIVEAAFKAIDQPEILKKLKVLIAEDNPTDKILLSYILNTELAIKDVEYARDGQEAH